MTAAANAPSAAGMVERVRVLTLNLGAVRVLREHEGSKPDELWRGSGFDADDEDVPVYLRLAEPLPAVAELVCAVIGRAAGLPVPVPYLVAVPAGSLPESRFAPPDGKALWSFASQDLGGANFAQLLKRDTPGAEAMLKAWEHLLPASVFDEWMANRDRHGGNLLFAAQALWMIDHADALGGSARQLFGLNEIVGDAFANHLAELCATTLGTPGLRRKALDKAQHWISDVAGAIDLPSAIVCCGAGRLQDEQACEELLDFMAERLTLTHALLCTRLGHPQLNLPPATGLQAQEPRAEYEVRAPSSSSRPT